MNYKQGLLTWEITIFVIYVGRKHFVFAGNDHFRVHAVLDVLARLLKAAIYFVVSVRPSVRVEQLGSPWTDFHEIWYLIIFRKLVEEIRVSLKSDMNNGYFTWRPIYIFIIPRSFILRMRNIWDKICRGNQNTLLCPITFFFSSKIVPFMR